MTGDPRVRSKAPAVRGILGAGHAALSWLNALLDRASESGIAKLAAISLALLGLANAAGIATFSGRYADSASFESAFEWASPFVWAGLYAVASSVLLFAAVMDRAFTVGATLGLAAVHTLLGLATIHAFVFGHGLPGAFINFASNGVFCFITFLMWRLRVRYPS